MVSAKEAENFLLSGRALDAEIEGLLEEAGRMRDAQNLLPKERHYLDALRQEILTKVSLLKVKREHIGQVIALIGDPEKRAVLYMRCLTGKTWLQISLALNMSMSAAHMAYKKGVQLAADAMDNEQYLT